MIKEDIINEQRNPPEYSQEMLNTKFTSLIVNVTVSYAAFCFVNLFIEKVNSYRLRDPSGEPFN